MDDGCVGEAFVVPGVVAQLRGPGVATLNVGIPGDRMPSESCVTTSARCTV